jgi:hypothetical protein
VVFNQLAQKSNPEGVLSDVIAKPFRTNMAYEGELGLDQVGAELDANGVEGEVGVGEVVVVRFAGRSNVQDTTH